MLLHNRPRPPPLLRVVEGDYRLWAASEGLQCTLNLGGSNPSSHGEGSPIAVPENIGDRIFYGDPLDNDTASSSRGLRSRNDSDDMYVRVKVCDSTLNASGRGKDQEGCLDYADSGLSSYKPIGLLQRYFERGARYALLTGTYVNNLRGGVLRRRFSNSLHEYDALGVKNPSSNTDVTAYGSIVQNLDALRVYGLAWSYRPRDRLPTLEYQRWIGPNRDDPIYCNSLGAILRNGYPGNPSAAQRGDCASWGNPFGEIYAEAVNYAIGGSATAAFAADDTTLTTLGIDDAGSLEDLQQVTWGSNADILGDLRRDLECSPVNIVAFNTSYIDHDADDIPASIGMAGNTITTAQIVGKTDQVGLVEIVGNPSRLVGSAVGTDNDYTCTTKTIGNLSDARGLCPGFVSGEGSYLSAGLAAHVHTEDLRTDRTGSQTISTYVLNLTPDLPIIRVPKGDPERTRELAAEIIPAYRNTRLIAGAAADENDGNRVPWFVPSVGQLVDFQVLQRHASFDLADCTGERRADVDDLCYMAYNNDALGTLSQNNDALWVGRYMVVWEDSVAGADYDQDLLGTVEYIYNETDNRLLVATHLLDVRISGDAVHLFGFVIAGTENADLDGFHAYSGHYNTFARDPIYSGAPKDARLRADPGKNSRHVVSYADPVNRSGSGDDFWGVVDATWEGNVGYATTQSVVGGDIIFSSNLGTAYTALGFPSVPYVATYGQFDYGYSHLDETGTANSNGVRDNLNKYTCTDTNQRNLYEGNRASYRWNKWQDYPYLTRYMLEFAQHCGADWRSGSSNCVYDNFAYAKSSGDLNVAPTQVQYQSLKVPACGWPLPLDSDYLLQSTKDSVDSTDLAERWKSWDRPTPPLFCYSQSEVGMDTFLGSNGRVVNSQEYRKAANDACALGRLSNGYLSVTAGNNAVRQDQRTLALRTDSILLSRPASTRAWHTFRMGDSYQSPYLESPLYYTAKWGGFQDSDGNNIPDRDSEWDSLINSSGAAGMDGLPDNYYEVTDPSQLETSLLRILLLGGLGQRTGSGTAAAVLANEREGLGGVYQAYLEVNRSDEETGDEVDWIGTLYALFIDPNGFLREDNNGDGELGDYTTDRVVEVFYDNSQGDTFLRRYTSSSSNEFIASGAPDVLNLAHLDPVWNSRERLGDLTDNQVITQRIYGGNASGGRHILTWIDRDLNRVVDTTEVVAFDKTAASGLVGSYYQFMDVEAGCAEYVVDYIRGRDASSAYAGSSASCAHVRDAGGVRNRSINYDSLPTGTAGEGREVMRLGDIAHSAPVAVSAPAESYDLLSGDISYGFFRSAYADRRQVIYVGANDGMLHAFNAGFYDRRNRTFSKALPGTGATEHPLGSELWGYVPGNLLPRLKYYMQENYEHMFFVDGIPRIFDARVFSEDSTHPGGWGTIMVVGFRLGGNPDIPRDGGFYGRDLNSYRVDTGGDGLCDDNDDDDDRDDIPFKSAFVVLDITDPESPPGIIAELSPIEQSAAVLGVNGCDQTIMNGLQFATSGVGVVPIDAPGLGPSGEEKWYIIIGTGTSDLIGLESTASMTPNLYIYDLADLVQGQDPNSAGALRTTSLNASAGEFVGSFVVADYDLDMKAEVAYFGTIGSSAADQGSLYRVHIGENADPMDWRYDVLLNTQQPIFSSPSVTLDPQGNSWVFFGSGRYLAGTDGDSDTTQTLYGIRDANPWNIPELMSGSKFRNVSKSGSSMGALVDTCGLLDVTDAVVGSTGVDLEGDGTSDYTSVSGDLVSRLIPKVDLTGYASSEGLNGTYYCGWYRDYPSTPGVTPVIPSHRSTTRTVLLADALFSTAFAPPGAQDIPGITPVNTDTTPSCVADLGISYLYGVDWRVGVASDSMLLGQVDCTNPGSSCPVGVTDSFFTTVVGLGSGLPSAPSLHIGSPGENVPGKVTVVLQQSTGETVTQETEADILLNTGWGKGRTE